MSCGDYEQPRLVHFKIERHSKEWLAQHARGIHGSFFVPSAVQIDSQRCVKKNRESPGEC